MHLLNILALTIALSLYVEGIFAESSSETDENGNLKYDITNDGKDTSVREKRYVNYPSVCCSVPCAPASGGQSAYYHQPVSPRPHPLLPPTYSYQPHMVVSNCQPITQQPPAVIVVQRPYVGHKPDWKGWRYGMKSLLFHI